MYLIDVLEHRTSDATFNVSSYIAEMLICAHYVHRLSKRWQPSLPKTTALSLTGLSTLAMRKTLPEKNVDHILVGPVAGIQLAMLYRAMKLIRSGKFSSLSRPVKVMTGTTLGVTSVEFIGVKGIAYRAGFDINTPDPEPGRYSGWW